MSLTDVLIVFDTLTCGGIVAVGVIAGVSMWRKVRRFKAKPARRP